MEGSLVLGIDSGSANTVAVLADLAGGEPQVIGVGLVPSAGVRRGMVVDLAAASESIKAAVAQAFEMAGRQGPAAAVASIGGTHIQSLICSSDVAVHRPSVGVTPEDVRRALDDSVAIVELPPGREVIHVVPRAYRLDRAEGVLNPIGLAGRRLGVEAHMITGDSLPRQNSLEAISRAGLQVTDFQAGIRAAGEAVLTRAEREAGVLLLDIGAGTTGVAVYDQGHLWHVSMLPLGGEHITADLAALLSIPVASSEALKVERGWAAADLAPDTGFELTSPSGQKAREVTDKQVAEIIESRVLEILQLAAAQVKRSGYAGLFPAGLVLTGGSARLQGLAALAGDSLGLQARVGCPEGPLVGSPEYATAVGLVQWGARLAQDEAAAAVETAKQNQWGRMKNWLRSLFG